MVTQGKGSVNSPIVISDDDDEETFIHQHLLSERNERSPSIISGIQPSDDGGDATHWERNAYGKGQELLLGMGYLPGQGLGLELDGQTEPVAVSLKRKRTRSGLGCDGSPITPTRPKRQYVQPPMTNTETKKARKRRKKIEDNLQREIRQLELENELQELERLEYERVHQVQTMGTGTAGDPYNLYGDSMMNPEPQDANFDQYYGHEGSRSFQPGYPQDGSETFWQMAQNSTLTSLPPLQPMLPLPMSQFMFQPMVPTLPTPQFDQYPYHQATDPQPSGSSSTDNLNHLRKPPLKRNLGAIGIQDEAFSYGTFRISPSLLLRPPKEVCTLVLEGIPRKFRSLDFVRSWSRSIKTPENFGPVRIEMEEPISGKALVEFLNSNAAKKAFDSPRMTGNRGQTGIRARWYKPNSSNGSSAPSSSSIVQEMEMEEGEITETAGNGGDATLTRKQKKSLKQQERAIRRGMSTRNELTLGDVHTGVAKRNTLPPAQATLQKPSAANWTPTTLPIAPPVDRPNLSYLSFSGYSSQAPSDDGHGREDHTHQVIGPGEEESKFDENDSIASSRASSQRPVEPEIIQSEDLTDMELESPVSPRQSRGFSSTVRRKSERPQTSTITADGDTEGPGLPSWPYTNPSAPLSVPIPQHPLPHIRSPSLTTVCHRLSPGVTSNSAGSPAFSETPPLSTPTPPTEPRAMKRLPTGPSYPIRLKRSLLTRAKELEERIAQSKLELSGVAENANIEVEDRASKENELRRLLLESKRSKASAKGITTSSAFALEAHDNDKMPQGGPSSLNKTAEPFSPSASAPPSTTASVSSVNSELSGSSSSATTESILSTPGRSSFFDDLAVTFITETIQTIKPPSTVQPLPTSRLLSMPDLSKPISSVKLELAAKQERLQKHITESKMLMAKLAAAKSKQERDSVLAALREKTRLMDEEAIKNSTKTVDPPPHVQTPTDGSRSNAQQRCPWPETHQDAGVFVISDDEEDDQ